MFQTNISLSLYLSLSLYIYIYTHPPLTLRDGRTHASSMPRGCPHIRSMLHAIRMGLRALASRAVTPLRSCTYKLEYHILSASREWTYYIRL